MWHRRKLRLSCSQRLKMRPRVNFDYSTHTHTHNKHCIHMLVCACVCVFVIAVLAFYTLCKKKGINALRSVLFMTSLTIKEAQQRVEVGRG